MADEFNFLRPEIKNRKAEADADLIPIPGHLELHGRCRCGVRAVYMLFCSLFVADLIVGMEELELHYRRRGSSNVRKVKIATRSARMVSSYVNEVPNINIIGAAKRPNITDSVPRKKKTGVSPRDGHVADPLSTP